MTGFASPHSESSIDAGSLCCLLAQQIVLLIISLCPLSRERLHERFVKRYWRLVFAFAAPTSPFELGEELVLEAPPSFVDRLLQVCIPVGLASYVLRTGGRSTLLRQRPV